TAAHPRLPFGTMVQVTNLENGKQVVVRINDRGPFGRRRVIDLSLAAARELDMVGPGTARVEVAVLGRYDLPPAQVAQPTLLAAAPEPADGWDPATPSGSTAAGIGAAGARDGAADAPGLDADARDARAAQDTGKADAADARNAQADRPSPAAAPAAAADRSDGRGSACRLSRHSLLVAAPAVHRTVRGPVAAAFHFTVQVGAFGEVERAEALRQDLALHYPAAAVHSDGTWSRVQVGLFDDRDQAEALRRELASAGLAAIVVAAR
ncbi:MAG TPA: septal ring lytic transglycosylase RlpA family protein, partial [Thermoanaerobaculia bacterium]|nr:septal ring lytic transglycosylase RlpA family protein [Thermoanaerobaculia bacterium]